MKTVLLKAAIVSAILRVAPDMSPSTQAEAFIQGSGIVLAAGQTRTFELPADGILNCTNINLGCDAVLRFTPNELNTPVYLLCTGDVLLNGGTIVVSGATASAALGGVGGPGGFPGGMGGIAGGHTSGGEGCGPGGGRNLRNFRGGAFGSPALGNSNVYGNALLYPLIGGSGGSGKNASEGGYAGGGGGGAILISSPTRIILSKCVTASGTDGTIYARGGAGANEAGGGGSGGAIRLVAPIVGGNGQLNAAGGAGDYVGGGNYLGSGSPGRIRIDCTDDYSYRTLTIVGSFSRGSQMFVFRPNTPRLDILKAAGKAIDLGTATSVVVPLPFGAPTNQTVTLRAENFTNDIPVMIAVTPDTGPAQFFSGVIPFTGPVSTKELPVVIPAGTISRIYAWTP